ncbi:MAG: hypothetical protein VX642_15680 [Bdellovibrionota bacterium]|nr:hypothetical protein [Bdellovibrionota bacterium]
MKKVLFVLLGIFVANVVYKFQSDESNNPLSKVLSNNVKEILRANTKVDSPEGKQSSKFLEAKEAFNREAKPSSKNESLKQVTNLQLKKSKVMNNEDIDKELDEYFEEGERLAEEDSELGSAYRAEVRLETRKLQKKLISQ